MRTFLFFSKEKNRNVLRFLTIVYFLFPLACHAATFQNIYLKDACIEAEVVNSPQERAQGLMSREHLGENQGMLFILERESRPSFWMKDMRFPLDIIWIDKEKQVVDITRNAMPCINECPGLAPRKEAQFVLELNSGFADKHNIGIGDILKIP